ncbi:MAG: L-histidine N(alpha)-methyltransferase [Actinomycetota bacterium]|nr:L-histidine N(alpha)-methyltransferase [Actinomycetota bacterium]
MRTIGDAPVTVSQLTPPTDHRAQLLEDVRHGFTAYRKHLPSKYFYDAKGSELFEQITTLPEYYLTRAETEILDSHADALMEHLRPDEMVELGSGSSSKTKLLIEAMHRVGGRRYVPIDISEDALRSAAMDLCTDYTWLEVEGLVGDYVADLDKVRHRGRRLIVFLGSTIGNYVPTLRHSLLRSVTSALGPGDSFMLGVDLVKDESTMVAAYDDSAGVSAEFNLNILRVVNRELDGDIPLDAFEHVTRFDRKYSCMEQSLRATRHVVANLHALDLAVTFVEGEEIHTEVSCKFTRDGVERDFGAAGMQLDQWLTDGQALFALAVASHV